MTGSRSARVFAVVQPVAGIVAGLLAFLCAPRLTAHAWHVRFNPFFATAATVIAALLVAIAIEARHAFRRPVTSTTIVLSLAAGELSSLVALCPVPADFERWLLALAVGGGIGGLVAVCVISAQTLSADLESARLEELGRWTGLAAAGGAEEGGHAAGAGGRGGQQGRSATGDRPGSGARGAGGL